MAGNGNGLARLRLIFAYVVAALWAVSVVISLLVKGHPIDPGVQLLAAAVATFLFGSAFRKKESS